MGMAAPEVPTWVVTAIVSANVLSPVAAILTTLLWKLRYLIAPIRTIAAGSNARTAFTGTRSSFSGAWSSTRSPFSGSGPYVTGSRTPFSGAGPLRRSIGNRGACRGPTSGNRRVAGQIQEITQLTSAWR